MSRSKSGSAFVFACLLGAAVVAPSPTNAVTPTVNGRIAFTSDRSGEWQIYTANPDGTDVAQLTSGSFQNTDPAWSPDGKRIAFVSRRDGNAEIYTMKADGSDQVRVTNDPGYDADPAWSPDGARIAFTGVPVGGYYDIYVINAGGTGRTNVTNNGHTATESGPTWSPDGARIAYASSDNRTGQKIAVMDADGANAHAISTINGSSPSWSPEGDRIAFTTGDIYTIAPDGSNLSQVTSTDTSESTPGWSPRGDRIVYARYAQNDAAHSEIWDMDPDGANQQKLITSSSANILPSWTFEPQIAPSIVVQPSDKAVAEGGTAAFRTTVDGSPFPKICWNVSTDDGANWSELVGVCDSAANEAHASSATDPVKKVVTLTLADVPADWSGRKFRAVATNASGSVTSDAATLTVDPSLAAPAVTSHPTSQTRVIGQTATFTAGASGTPTPSVQWQVLSGAAWSDLSDGSGVSGTSTRTLTLSSVTTAMSGNKYRAVFTNDSGAAASNSATLTVTYAALAITKFAVGLGYFYPYLQDGNRDYQSVSFAFNRPASYQFQIINSAGSVIIQSPKYSGSSGTWKWNGRKSDGTWAPAGAYRTRLYAGAAGSTVKQTSDTFYVKPGPIAITGFQVRLGYIYPYVQDGNRDYQQVDFAFSTTSSYRFQVINSSGAAIAQSPMYSGRSGTWRWGGRKSDGSLAPNGGYRIRVIASAGGATATRTSSLFYVKSGYTWEFLGRQTRSGEVGSPATSGPCYIYRDPGTEDYWDPFAHYDPNTGEFYGDWVYGDPGYAEIDCWGGTGLMRYDFRIPSSAAKFNWAVDGELSGSDICCQGGISKSGTRTSSTTFRVTVKVTEWRAFIVNSVRLDSYAKKYY